MKLVALSNDLQN